MQNHDNRDLAISIISSIINRSNEIPNVYDAALSYSPDPNLTEPVKIYVYKEYIRDLLRQHHQTFQEVVDQIFFLSYPVEKTDLYQQ